MTRLPAETLTIEGPDALAFAHAQLGSHIDELAVGAWQWSAWLNPQGRVRALLQLVRPHEETLLALLRGGSAEALARALAPYLLRRQAKIHAQPVRALVDAPAIPVGQMVIDGDEPTLGMGDYAMRIATGPAHAARQWQHHAIEAGHPWLPDNALDRLLGPALSCGELGATRLDKGCYPGQEIVARMHYRGNCPRHLRRMHSDAPLPAGSPLSIDGDNVGLILNSVEAGPVSRALAVMRDATPLGHITARIGETGENVRIYSELVHSRPLKHTSTDHNEN